MKRDQIVAIVDRHVEAILPDIQTHLGARPAFFPDLPGMSDLVAEAKTTIVDVMSDYVECIAEQP